MCQPGWEDGLEEKGYMYICGGVPSLFTSNYQILLIGYIPIQNKKFKFWKKKKKRRYMQRRDRKKRRRSCDHWGGPQSDAASRHWSWKVIRSWKRWGMHSFSSKSLQRQCSPPNTLTSNFWSPELQEYISLVLSQQIVVMCYGGLGKWI